MSLVPVQAENSQSIDEIQFDLSDTYKKQRSIFIKAEYALNLKRYKKYQQYYKNLDGYPLQVYLKYREYQKKLSQKTEQQIFTFLLEIKDTPYEDRLRVAWLNHKAKKKQWQQYLKAYIPQTNTGRQCHYLHALIKTKQQEKAFAQVSDLWLVGKSQPKSCDPVFKAFKKAGKLTPQLLWDRITLAMQKGRTSLANYLARSLNANDQLWVKEWISIYKKPDLALNSKLLRKTHPIKTTILVHAIERRVRQHPTAAIDLFEALDKKTTFSPQEYAKIYRSIGMKLAYRHKPKAWNWLDKVSDEESDKKIQQWRARSAIREGNWESIGNAIERLPEEERNKSHWQYWQASKLEIQGHKEEAQKSFSKLANDRGYYNFLAADKMEMPYEFNDRPLAPDKETLQRVASHPGILRAREFYLLGRKLEARRDWYFTTRKQMSLKDREVAAKIAQLWGWHNRAIITIAKTDNRDDMELRFPIAQHERVTKYSKQQQLQPAYTMAVIRRESAFAEDARSRVGALGLMQIMPATGKQIAGTLKVKYKNKQQLLNPETNVKFGTKYLNMMLRQFYTQPALASAAYNAGGHRVKAWLPTNEDMQADRWIETIPFTETRKYVRSILAYTAIYEYRLDLPQTRLSKHMPDVPKKK
ncbi:MAG: transglycosylase SLT domain-containing protein [gamma proteobacterium symbiont of Taylorina sp.]|nr:transglycosylase SLT domain-containing protein [gamma proteobacterium symbiont of Taylorina sp.]